jgi:beta-lactamase class D
MKTIIITLILFVLPANLLASKDLGFLFKGKAGTLVLYDESKNKTYRYNEKRAKKRYPPCSTFKIAHSLIALDSMAIDNKEHQIKWNPNKHNKKSWWPKSWTKDHNLTSAFKNSVLWYYQDLVNKVGIQKYHTYLKWFDYGNHKIKGNPKTFWLENSLKISADEQITFLKKLKNGDLGLSSQATETVQELMILDKDKEGILRGKTGTCLLSDSNKDNPFKGPLMGWLVGYYEDTRGPIYYALQVEGENYKQINSKVRMGMIKKALEMIGLSEEE